MSRATNAPTVTVMSTLTDTPTPPEAPAVEAFAERLVGAVTDAFLTALVDIGRRTGLFEAAARGPATSTELAERAGLHERYVREWLGAMVTGGYLDYDPGDGRYTLPAEHAALLTGDSVDNLAPLATMATVLTRHVDAVTRCFTEGGGVPWAAYCPEVHEVLDLLGQPLVRDLLVPEILPLAPGLPERLREGARLADVACGSGNVLVRLGAEFPRSTFVGFDQDEPAILEARRRAADAGLDNVRFEVADAAGLTTDEPFDAVTVFNAVHDQARPDEVLRAIHGLLRPGGTLLLDEPRVSSRLEENVGNPLAPMIYAISLLHCMTVSLAEGGAGLGTAWGEQTALRMLAEAGFGEVQVHEAPGDPGNAVFVTHR
jgi:SAM-dependent methyltransferase